MESSVRVMGQIRMILKTVPQSEINYLIFTILAQAGLFRAVEKHISGGNLPVVADFVFCEDLRG